MALTLGNHISETVSSLSDAGDQIQGLTHVRQSALLLRNHKVTLFLFYFWVTCGDFRENHK